MCVAVCGAIAHRGRMPAVTSQQPFLAIQVINMKKWFQIETVYDLNPGPIELREVKLFGYTVLCLVKRLK
ncbi:hypothetical protein [Brevibacillus choshinensis]|uniref:hypothetical protein n=1 Tax=Brevibacillus choshinensis TaxID=54911 RepID=UPI002E1BD4F7|nr:hypothetical protein [Brevibacillus choshinensis]